MNNHSHIPAQIRDFSLAFQQMCSFVAIGQTKNQEETLRELILQILVLFPDENISSEQDLSKLIRAIFGMQIADHEIRSVLDRLLADRTLIVTTNAIYRLDNEIAKLIQENIDEATYLEEYVRKGYSMELMNEFPELDFTQTWEALRSYLAGAFLRHGIQAVALLDSSVELNHIYQQRLTDLLNEIVKSFPEHLMLDAKRAISSFVATSGAFPERAKYISQLADGAFSYFSLATDPKVANRLRENLSPLTLFLDTNFLFGILGLTTNPQVSVSNELLRTIQQYKFPFNLKRHSRTDDELINSISYYEDTLSKRQYSKNISRAATKSRILSGVEVKYHQAFVDNGIDVQSFFRPFRHIDIILNEKSIELFEEIEPDENTQQDIATLIADFEEFLKNRGREKTYRIIEHDMKLLSVVRRLRSKAKSTLDAGALIITCDYNLYTFDWETSKKLGIQPCCVLPNLLWQILHPFIPSDEDFSIAFAQTFAIPEFRTINSGAADACSKMLNIMAGYKDFPEATAERMLSNDVLIDKLRKAQNDEEFQRYIDDAIIEENAHLWGEKVELSKKYDLEKSEKDQLVIRLEETNDLVKQEKQKLNTEKEQRIQAEKMVIEEKYNREIAELSAIHEKEGKEKALGKLNMVTSIGNALLFGVLSVAAFEIIIHVIPWDWLLTHSESYGLQISFDIFMIGVGFAIFVKRWRNATLFALIISSISIFVQLLGGPN